MTGEWRSSLETGDLLDKAAEAAWELAGKEWAVPATPDPYQTAVLESDDAMKRIAKTFATSRNSYLFGEDFTNLLLNYHARVHLLGQGPKGSETLARAHAQQVMFTGRGSQSVPEIDFLTGFVNDLVDNDPRYIADDGAVNVDEVLRRMRMYEGKLRGSEGWGHVDVLTPTEDIWWVIAGIEDHCEVCPYNESVSPWTKETLYTTPGSGDTPCLFNCKCHLEFAGGQTSAKPMAKA